MAKTSKKTGTAKSAKRSARAGRTPTKAAARSGLNELMGFPLKTWIQTVEKAKGSDLRSGKRGFVLVFGSQSNAKLERKLVSPHLKKWQLVNYLESESESQFFQGGDGPVWILRPGRGVLASRVNPHASLDKSSYARTRDLVGAVVPALGAMGLEKLILEMHGLSINEESAALIGLEMGSYSYSENRPEAPKPRKKLPKLFLKESALDETKVRAAADLALSVNIARHLTNIPGGDLNPETYADALKALFSSSPSVKVEIWEGEKLVNERMGLLLAVGRAAHAGPRLVHLSYRPKSSAGRPIAIVGKGITFDSGGLDIKPSSGMRWMKKDMGGSAAAVGIVKWAERSAFPLPLDVYLSLAENAVGANAFRPGDVIVARNGQAIEIGNTDAEGRLVMADAIDVAVTHDEKPQCLIDLATLTGAIKVALGTEIAGLFANSDDLANVLTDAGLERGDLMWRMPLFQQYRSHLKSNSGDMNNCSDSGFGGAISAALFLESFVKDVPWAHLDIYAWRDAAGGAWAEQGGSGQPVQALALALTRLAEASGAIETA